MSQAFKLNLNILHPDIAELTSNDENIGYIVINKNEGAPYTFVLPTGKELADFSCPHCVVKAAMRNHLNIPNTIEVELEHVDLTRKKLMLIALLAAQLQH